MSSAPTSKKEQLSTSGYNIEEYKLDYRACISLRVLLDQTLSANEIRLYGLIEQMESSTGAVYFCKRTFAEILFVSHSAKKISKMLQKLKNKKYIKSEFKEVLIRGKLEFRYCYSTVKGAVFISEDDQQPKPQATPPEKEPESKEDENNTGGVSVVPPPGVSVVPPPGVSVVPPCNTHQLNPQKNKHTKSGECGFFFEKFWSVYPGQKAEKTCRSIWKRRGLESIGQEIFDAVCNQKKNDRQWIAGFNPSAKTYLLEDRWNDEITPTVDAKKQQEREQQRLEAQQREKEQAAFTEKQRLNDLNKQTDAKVFRNIKQAVKGNGYEAFRASMNLKQREASDVQGE